MSDSALLGERETAVLRWRCRRGLVENDLFLDRFFAAFGERLSTAQASGLSALMALPDNDLLDLFLRRAEPRDGLDTPEVKSVLEQLRQPSMARP